jgi:hypothetical protein
MSYRVFKRRWWRDSKCTVPGAGRKTHVAWAQTEEEAQDICRSYNWCPLTGTRIRRPYGLAAEYEKA